MSNEDLNQDPAIVSASPLAADGERKSAVAGTKLLPGMAIIALFMLVEAGRTAYAVYAHQISGQNRYGAMGIATILLGCGMGLLQRRRWGWALTLAMAFLSLCFFSFVLMRLHAPQALAMTFVNGVMFLYLIRPEVRVRLR